MSVKKSTNWKKYVGNIILLKLVTQNKSKYLKGETCNFLCISWWICFLYKRKKEIQL